jgi:hypothetical protein
MARKKAAIIELLPSWEMIIVMAILLISMVGQGSLSSL